MAKELVLTKAQNAVLSHDWSTAAKLYKELLKGDESNVEYLKELGSIYVKAGEDERAIPYYEQIITFYPHYIEAMNSLGAIHRRLKHYEESIQILQRAKDEGRDTASVNYNLGFTYKEMGNYEDAIDAFESVITENPDDVLAYNHLGSIYFTQKNYEKSISAYKRGLQVDPNHPILNYNLARCYEAANSYPDAVRCYNAALKTRPGWTDAIHDFSGLLIKCQQTKAAQDLVEQSIKLHPMNTDLLYILGNIYLHQFDYDNAAHTLKKADSIKSSDIQILSALAEALEKGAKTEQALEKVLEAMDVDPNNKAIRKQYVHTLLSAQHYDKALENVKELYEENGENDVEILDLYGQYFICRGDDDAANVYFEKIRKLNHHYKNYMLEAADRYVQTGEYEKAEKYARDFVERRTKSPEGYAKLGKIYEASGKLRNARAFYEKSLNLSGGNVSTNSEIRRLDVELQKNPDSEDIVNSVLFADRVNDLLKAPDVLENGTESEKPSEAISMDSDSNVGAPESENAAVEVVPSMNDLAENNGAFDSSVFGDDIPSAEELGLDSLSQDEEEHFDFSQMADGVPLSDELAEEAENDFWSEFDDEGSEADEKAGGEENATAPGAENTTAPANDTAAEEKAVPESAPEPNVPADKSVPSGNAVLLAEDYIKQAVDKAVDEKFQELSEQAKLEDEEEPLEPEESLEEPLEDGESALEEGIAEDSPEEELDLDEEQPSEEESGLDAAEVSVEEEPDLAEAAPLETGSFENDTGLEEVADEEETSLEDVHDADEEPAGENADTLLRSMESADYMLDKIQKILNDTDLQAVSADKIELFKTLRTLLDYLPEGEKNNSITRRMNMLLQYLIEKLSGKPGLLATSESLIKSGVLGDEYLSHLRIEKEGVITNSLISKVLCDMKNMSLSLPDSGIAKALCASADGILEQIELEDQKSRIF